MDRRASAMLYILAMLLFATDASSARSGLRWVRQKSARAQAQVLRALAVDDTSSKCPAIETVMRVFLD